MSQSPTVSDDSDFYGEDGDVEVQVQHNDAAQNGTAPSLSPASDAMPMDESPSASPAPERITIKRKLSSVEDEAQVAPKRQKVTIIPEQYFSSAVDRTAGLPAEAWQHVFLYLTPDSLSCCLSVNKAFHAYLTSVAASQSVRLPPRRTGLKLLDSEAIWTSARKLFASNLPRPLAGFGEMQMFQLLGGKYCQICGALPTGHVQARTPFDAGPGSCGVRIIWSFSARMCGKCFDTSCLKDTEILQSPAAPLRAGLPHAFRTNDLHYIPATTLQANPAGAPRGHMYKVYYRKHIDDLHREHEDAKEFGEAAAEEWVKGLPLNGKQQMADAARWERWEALQPPGTHPAKTLREYFRPVSALSAPVSDEPLAAAPPAVPATVPPPPPANGSSLQVLSQQPMKHPLPARVVAVNQAASASPLTAQPSPHNNTATSSSSVPPAHSLPSPQAQPSSYHQQQPHALPSLQNFAQPQQPQQSTAQQLYRPPRNQREVEEARLARKAEIERRCQEEFYPPLLPDVLQHMESFRAALIIVTPLTDQAWEVLKPRLCMQRDAAEQVEYQRGEQLRALQATIPDPSYRDAYSKTANEAAERQWESQQAPVRKKLAKLADEFIRGKWNGGKGLSRETAPAFAVEVLLYARNKHVEKNTPKDQVNKEGPRSPSDPAFVSLENMRWLFDNKVKTLTEKHCRELFICAECEGVTKGYAFEGMIQHFGAKHTSDFSQGNIVVHWQTADWPDEPPFVPTKGQADPTLPVKREVQQYGSYGYPSTGNMAPVTVPNFAPGQLESLYAALNNGQPSATPATTAHSQYQSQVYPQGQPASYSAPPQQLSTAYSPVTAAPPAAPAVPQFGAPINIHEDQVNEIATTALEIWDSTSGVKDMVESIRMETVLHHVVKRFKGRFSYEPSLDLITDALANHILMKPIKNCQPLACKTCVSSSLGSALMYKPYPHRLADNKTYNISSLITHFKTVHVGGGGVDWKEDMIEMADEDQIKQLLSAPGMDDDKLAIIAAAFPSVFTQPLPRIGRISEREDVSTKKARDWDDGPRANGNRRDKKKNKRKNGKRGLHDQDDAEQSDMPEAGEDEYDPRRPAFIDAAPRGRRSLGGRTSNGHATAQPSIDPSVFTPETLAALSKLAPALNLGAAIPGARSPSIPRAANEAAFHANQRATYHPADPAANHNPYSHHQEKETNGRNKKERRNRRSGAGVSGAEDREPEEDYTQVIRTAPAAEGDYSATSLSQHPGVVPAVSPRQYAAAAAHERSHLPEPPAPDYDRVAVDQYGRPVGYEPQRYEERPVQYVDEYGRPIQYAPPPPREEVRYVDQYGRPVEVVRVVERPAAYDRPMYEYPPEYPQPPSGHEYLPQPNQGREYGAPSGGYEYGAPPPAHEYAGGHPEYARQPDPYMRAPPERLQYVDEYGRPLPYASAPY